MSLAGREHEEARPPRLCIKTNNSITNDPCYLCGQRTDPTGLDLFYAGTEALVCDDCGLKYAPELAKLLRLPNAAEAS